MKPSASPTLLKDSINLFSHNGRLMAITAILYLILSSFFFFFNHFSTKSLISDLLPLITDIISATAGTSEFAHLLTGIKEDIGIFLAIELGFLVIYFLITLFAQTATIFISAFSYSGSNSLSPEELISRVADSWTRPLVTGISVTLLSLGYTTLFILPIAIPTLIFFDHHRVICLSVLAVVAILFVFLYLYLSVVWVMGMVVSVIEESSGLEALGKAKVLVEGLRPQGFGLNVMVSLVLLIISAVPYLIRVKLQWGVHPMVLGLIQLFFTCLVRMFQFMAYTVLYFRGKKNHKMQSFMEYFEVTNQEFFV